MRRGAAVMGIPPPPWPPFHNGLVPLPRKACGSLRSYTVAALHHRRMTESPNLHDPADAHIFVDVLRERGDVYPGAMLIALVDSAGEPIGGICVEDIPADPPQHERVRMLGPLLRSLAQHGLCTGVLLAVGRRGAAVPSGGDLAWHDAFAGTCGVAGLTCHGTYVVTPHRVLRLDPHRPETAA